MMSKRLLSIALTLSMLLTIGVFTTATQAAIGIEHEEQVSKLNAFGILSGYPDSGYQADAQVAAKDFTIAAYKLAGKDGDMTEILAEQFGFKAEDKSITVQQAAAVLLTALDFKYEAESYGSYPDGYYQAALNHKLLKGIRLARDANLTNDAMAVMLYNALDVKLPEVTYSEEGVGLSRGGKTVLENLEIYRGSGIVTGTQYAAVNGCSLANAETIIIDNTKSYSLGKTYADELFGYSVEFYYNDEEELLWIDARNNMTVVRIAEVDIISLDASGISYYNEKDRRKSYSFDAPTFVYNGKSVQNPDLTSFIPESGYVLAIDNDGDGRAEIVSCEAYEYYLVNGKNTANQTISDFETGGQLSLNPDEYDSIKIIKDGVVVTFADINENDVVAVMKSDADGGVLRAEVSTYAPVTGSIMSLSASNVKIADTFYKVSTAYRGAELAIDKTGTFYLDNNGNIVRFAAGKNVTSKYAYLIAAAVDGYENCSVQLLTAGGTVETRKVQSKVRHNDQSVSAVKLFERLWGNGKAERQLIIYSLNSKGEVNRIDTANKNNLFSGSDEAADEFSLYYQGRGRYRKNNLCFNSKYLIDADTPIFVVPSSRKSEDYGVIYAQGLTNGTSYYISVYDIDEYMTAGAIVLDELESEPEQLKSKRSILVDEVLTGLNEDNEKIVILEGYQQGSKVTLKTKEQLTLKDAEGRYYSLGDIDGYTPIAQGDVIQASLDTEGNLLAFRTLYKADETRKNLVIASNDTPNEYEEGGNVNEFSDLFVLSGEVISRSANVLVVKSDTKRAHKITNGVSVYIVSKRQIEKGTTSDIGAHDKVYLHTYQGNLQEVIIYTNR